MGQERSFTHQEGNAGISRVVLQVRGLIGPKRNDRKMAGFWVLLKPGERGTDFRSSVLQVDENQHGFGLFSRRVQQRRVADGLDAVSKLLQAIDKAAARQYSFIENERKRLRHEERVAQCRVNGKYFTRSPVNWSPLRFWGFEIGLDCFCLVN